MDFVIDLAPTHCVLRTTVTTVLTDVSTKIYRTIAWVASRGGPYAAITDVSHVVDFRVSSDTVRALAVSSPAVPGGPRVLVASKPALYGLARMGALIRDAMGEQLQIVRSIGEAYDLLKVTPQDFSQRLLPKNLAV